MRKNMAEIQIIYRNKRINNKKGVLIILTTLKTYKNQMVFNNLKINKKHLIVKEIKVKYIQSKINYLRLRIKISVIRIIRFL